MIHLYAFVSDVRDVPKELDVVDAGGVEAVVGEPLGAGDRVAAAIEHGTVIESLRAVAGAVLPVRLGDDFADIASLAAAVAPRSAALRRRLAEVHGCAEVSVRAVGDVETSGDAVDGTSYMTCKLAPFRLRTDLEERLHAPLARRAQATHLVDFASLPVLLDASYLVADDRVGEFAEEVSGLATAWPELSIACTGPWAPYSFAEEAA
jgi:hypothetical protein